MRLKQKFLIRQGKIQAMVVERSDNGECVIFPYALNTKRKPCKTLVLKSMKEVRELDLYEVITEEI